MSGSARPERRDALDVLRGAAVVGMLATHVAHLQQANAPCARVVVAALLGGEPLVTHAFFWVSGAALARSAPAWAPARAARRVASLWAIGVALFVLQFGWQWPDALCSADVLSGLAWLTALLAAVRSLRGLQALAALVVAAQLLAPAGIVGLDAGPGGAVPLLLSGLAAACVERDGARARWVVFGLGVVALLLLLVFGAPFVVQVPSVYRCFDGVPLVAQLAGESGHGCTRWFWNPTLVGTLACTAVLAIADASLRDVAAWPAWRPLRALGRASLPIYVAHLLALGAADAFGLRPTTAAAGLAAFAALLLLACALVFARRALRRRLTAAP